VPPWGMHGDIFSNFIETAGPKRLRKAIEVQGVLCNRRQCGGATFGPRTERSEIKIGVTSHTIRQYLLHRCTLALRLRDDVWAGVSSNSCRLFYLPLAELVMWLTMPAGGDPPSPMGHYARLAERGSNFWAPQGQLAWHFRSLNLPWALQPAFS